MIVKETGLSGLLLIEPKRNEDTRGFFSEVFRSSLLKDYGVLADFVQDNHVFSNEAGVLRGLHYQAKPYAQDKLVRVIRGAIYDVVLDIRVGSPSYGEWYGVELSAENWKQLLIPKGFAHGYVALDSNTEVSYKVTDYYRPEAERGILWCDPVLEIDWKLGGLTPILSAKDKSLPIFETVKGEFDY